MYQRILAPFDRCATSNRGLAKAVALTSFTGSRLRIVHGVDGLSGGSLLVERSSAARFDKLVELLRSAGETLLRDARARDERFGLAVETVLLEGAGRRLADVVSDLAESWSADLIGLGIHAHPGRGHLAPGRDPEQIVHRSSMPALRVRAPTTVAVYSACRACDAEGVAAV